jgi:hypothetical protein
MEALGLVNRNSVGEVERSKLGTAIVYLALKEGGFAEVARIMRCDRKLANEWGL